MDKKLLLLAALLAAPQCLAAEADAARRFTDKEDIEFAPSSKQAFDRSGSRVSHVFLPGGVMLAEHNGTMGNITVARLGTDGMVETFCTTSEDAARAWMAGEDFAPSSHALHLVEGED